MREIIDNSCWEEHKKLITFDQHKIKGLKNLAYWNYTTAAPPSPPHYHSDIVEIHCLLKGKRVCYVNEDPYTITGGEMFLTLPYEIHHTSSFEACPCSFIAFQIDISDKYSLLGLDEEYSHALHDLLMQNENRHLRFRTRDAQILQEAFDNISDNDPNSLRLGVQYLCCFLFNIQEFVPVRSHGKQTIDANIRRVLDRIDTTYQNSLRLNELAALSGYSLSRFKAKFKEVIGITPANYINLKKLEHAKHLLATTDLPITQIALDAGFSSANYFTTMMKHITSQTPTEFRRMCRENSGLT